MKKKFISTTKHKNSVYVRVSVPISNQLRIIKKFLIDPDNPDQAWHEAEAFRWFVGCEEWGESRFTLLLSGAIPTQRLTQAGSVNCYLAHKVEPHGSITRQWTVSWRENKITKARCFGKRRYGSLAMAAHQAHLFAARKRAEQTLSTLSLPDFEFDLSELYAHIQD